MGINDDLKNIMSAGPFSMQLTSEGAESGSVKTYKGHLNYSFKDSSGKVEYKRTRAEFITTKEAAEIKLESFVVCDNRRFKVIFIQHDPFDFIKLELIVWEPVKETSDGKIWE